MWDLPVSFLLPPASPFSLSLSLPQWAAAPRRIRARRRRQPHRTARQLLRFGIRVLILEGRARPGGHVLLYQKFSFQSSTVLMTEFIILEPVLFYP